MKKPADSRKHLLIVNDFHSETLAKLDSLYQTHHLHRVAKPEQADFLHALDGKCRAAVSASWVCDPAVYDIPSLQFIACFGVGVDGIDFQRTAEAGIRVSNTPGVLDDAVADLGLALLLGLARDIANADRFVRDGSWLKGPYPFGTSLAGKTLGILGLGRIGEAVARRALPFGLHIAYYNRHPKPVPYTYHDTPTALATASDILLCVLPGGKATQNIVDREVLKALGPKGYFINIGRGTSVNEPHLIEALQNGQIAAAGLDVYEREPDIPESLKSLNNVLLLPHIGSATPETRGAMGNLVIDNLAAFFANHPLPTEVPSVPCR